MKFKPLITKSVRKNLNWKITHQKQKQLQSTLKNAVHNQKLQQVTMLTTRTAHQQWKMLISKAFAKLNKKSLKSNMTTTRKLVTLTM